VKCRCVWRVWKLQVKCRCGCLEASYKGASRDREVKVKVKVRFTSESEDGKFPNCRISPSVGIEISTI